jgi:tubulin polyglutamylase TTLL1
MLWEQILIHICGIRICKTKLLSSFITINFVVVYMHSPVGSVRWNKVPSPEALGNFELLLDEELASQDENPTNQSRSRSDTRGPLYRWK